MISWWFTGISLAKLLSLSWLGFIVDKSTCNCCWLQYLGYSKKWSFRLSWPNHEENWLVTNHSLGDPSFSRSATSHLDDPLQGPSQAPQVPHGQLAVIWPRLNVRHGDFNDPSPKYHVISHVCDTLKLSVGMHLFTASEQLNMVKYYPDTAMIPSCYPTISHEVLQSFAAKCHSTLKQLVLLGRQRWVILPSEPWGITSSAQLEGPGGKKKGERKGHPNPSPQIDLIGYLYI